MKKLNTAQAELVGRADKINQLDDHWQSLRYNLSAEMAKGGDANQQRKELLQFEASQDLTELFGLISEMSNALTAQPDFKEIAGKLAEAAKMAQEFVDPFVISRGMGAGISKKLFHALQEYNALVASGGGE